MLEINGRDFIGRMFGIKSYASLFLKLQHREVLVKVNPLSWLVWRVSCRMLALFLSKPLSMTVRVRLLHYLFLWRNLPRVR